jgi:hypothetical protein
LLDLEAEFRDPGSRPRPIFPSEEPLTGAALEAWLDNLLPGRIGYQQ